MNSGYVVHGCCSPGVGAGGGGGGGGGVGGGGGGVGGGGGPAAYPHAAVPSSPKLPSVKYSGVPPNPYVPSVPRRGCVPAAGRSLPCLIEEINRSQNDSSARSHSAWRLHSFGFRFTAAAAATVRQTKVDYYIAFAYHCTSTSSSTKAVLNQRKLWLHGLHRGSTDAQQRSSQTRLKDRTSLRQNRFSQPLASLQWPPPRVIRYAAPSGLTPPAPERKPQAVGGAQWGATGVRLHSLRCVVG